jgi:hypothetical protein
VLLHWSSNHIELKINNHLLRKFIKLYLSVMSTPDTHTYKRQVTQRDCLYSLLVDGDKGIEILLGEGENILYGAEEKYLSAIRLLQGWDDPSLTGSESNSFHVTEHSPTQDKDRAALLAVDIMQRAAKAEQNYLIQATQA